MINEQVIGDILLTTCRNYSSRRCNPQEVYEIASRLVFSKLRLMMSKARSKDAQVQGYDFFQMSIDAVKQAHTEITLRNQLMDKEYGPEYYIGD